MLHVVREILGFKVMQASANKHGQHLVDVFQGLQPVKVSVYRCDVLILV